LDRNIKPPLQEMHFDTLPPFLKMDFEIFGNYRLLCCTQTRVIHHLMHTLASGPCVDS